ncbi:MAG: hypothetical protein FJY97_20855 [candidate division Zixibacteria bacterium]|nr:hypothetical protein [candidate division Zixibacteria bacterium]
MDATGKVVFEDRFENGTDAGWTWLREHSGHWRMRDGGLEIQVEPGVADTVRNALVRPAPDRNTGTFAIEVTVANHTVPVQQYEQAGITWYVAGKPVFKIVKELIDGDLYIIPGRPSMRTKSVRLRLIVTASTWEAQYRPEGETTFLTAATGELPPPDRDEVSIQCYNGPPNRGHWIRFEHFVIRQI